jgi:hypothetical protein
LSGAAAAPRLRPRALSDVVASTRLDSGDASLVDQARDDASICSCSQRRSEAIGRQSCSAGG